MKPVQTTKASPVIFCSFPRGSERRLRPHQALSHAHSRLHRCNFKGALAEGGPTPAASRREGRGGKNLSHMWLPNPLQTLIFFRYQFPHLMWDQSNFLHPGWNWAGAAERRRPDVRDEFSLFSHMGTLGQQRPPKVCQRSAGCKNVVWWLDKLSVTCGKVPVGFQGDASRVGLH